jgi:UDP-N-acetylmuramoylalanine--D-glutamate ligase
MDLEGRRIVIVGAARQGTALAAYAARHGARVTITDARPAAQLQSAISQLAGLPIDWQLGAHPFEMLDGADMLAVSGGVPTEMPLVLEAQRRGIAISNDSQLFLELTPCPVIGITGSAGKTTTTTLVGRILQSMQGQQIRRAWVGGNIGNPLITNVDEMQVEDLAVMELSSFQLEWMTRAPQVAAILNIAPNHLDRHGTMEIYTAAKARILDFQTAEDVAVLCREDAGSWALASRVQGRLISFGRGELPAGQYGSFVREAHIWLRDEQGERELLPLSAIELRGEHNLLNVIAACTLAANVGATSTDMLAGVSGFRGAPHRLEWVASVNGADYYNDSIATAPQRAEAAIHSFEQPLVLLLGGRDKGLPWQDLATLAAQRAHHVVLFGEAAEMLAPIFARHAAKLPVTVAADLAAAVSAAAAATQPGDVVLLSPGGTSFDEFIDFEARGERFRELVKEL